MNDAVILDGVRTAYGKRGGAYRNVRPDSLLALTLQKLMERTGIASAHIDDVITGCVTEVNEQGSNIGRFAALLAGLPPSVPAVSLNRACGSSQQAFHFAAQAIAAGDADYVIGAGVESMTRVPMFSDIAASGFDTFNPALQQQYELVHQGESAERIAKRWDITREQVDTYSAESHRRAYASREHHTEVVTITGADASGNPLTLTQDEGIRATVDLAKMASLAPAFRSPGEGVVTAANSSQVSDGASAVLIANRERALADGFRPRARFRARVVVGDDPTLQLTAVIPATTKALEKAHLSLADMDWIEINEAFATVVLAWAKEFNPDMNRVNPWGGAIAHGHPLGASGAGLMAKMLAGLEFTDGQFGLQVMCIGAGMATASIIERM